MPKESGFSHFLYKMSVRKDIALVILLAWDLVDPGSVSCFAAEFLCVLG